METIAGFTVITGMAETAIAQVRNAAQCVIGRFENIESCTVHVGQTELEIWGHPEIAARMHKLHNGDVLVLVGSPRGEILWDDVEEELIHGQRGEDYALPWDGSVILLRISADGKTWSMWNDRVGSIPVYYAQKNGMRITSTLEPVVVAGAGVGADDILLPGLASLMINGHFLADWTLYKNIKVVRADSCTEWDEDGCRWTRLWTVKPSEARWAAGWDELVDEMYELSREAILSALREQPSWVLPLSSGLDSRLIAAAGAEAGVEMHAYSWGTPWAKDVVYAREIARTQGYHGSGWISGRITW